MKILVCGGRDYADQMALDHALDRVHAQYGITLLIEGGARGADRLARAWARRNKVKVRTVNAEWERYGPMAGLIRNSRMLGEEQPEAVVAFPGGTGTADMVGKAEAHKLPVWKTGGWKG